MLGAQYLLLILVYCRAGSAIEEDNLRNALNSIENRQRQLASNYYQLPNKDPGRPLLLDDDNLMFLDSSPSDNDLPHHSRLGPPSKPSKSYRYYEDDRLGGYDEAEEYEKSLNERALDQILLDYLKYEEEDSAPTAAHRRPQKKSFFREREINEIADNLQSLYPSAGADADDALYPPTSFRERVKSRLRAPQLRRPARPEDGDEGADVDDYLNAVDPLWRKYEGVDPDALTEEDASLFLQYLTGQAPQPDVYSSELRSRERSKRYWLGSAKTPKYAIRKRSADEKPVKVATNETRINGTTAPVNKTVSGAVTPAPAQILKKVAKRGQQEVPVDLQSLKPLNIKKKSVDWSNYFGVDKRQKKSGPAPRDQLRKNDPLLDQYIQSYILQNVRSAPYSSNRYLPKREISGKPFFGSGGQRLDTNDLQAAEDMIIDNVLKYTGAHEGISDPAEVQRVRQEVIEELWLAYNLEKMRENFLYNDAELKESAERSKKEHQHSTKKRVAVKKENADLTQPDIENEKKNKHNSTSSGHSTSKKSFIDYNKYRYDISDGGDDCPVLNQIIDDCLQISTEVKDRDRIFTPYCTLHQICNICGNKQDSLSCDLSFFTDANAVCADEPVCRYTAERVLYLIKNQPLSTYLSGKVCDSCISQILPYNVEN